MSVYFPKKMSSREHQIPTTSLRKRLLHTTLLQHKERSTPRAATRVQNPLELFKNNLYKVRAVRVLSVFRA